MSLRLRDGWCGGIAFSAVSNPIVRPNRSNPTTSETKVSRNQGSVTYNKGFWIGWLHLLAFLLQLLLFKIDYNNSQSVTVKDFPFLPGLRTSSIVTDFVLIYEWFTSSASVVCWLKLHSWTLNHDCNLTDLRMPWVTTPGRLNQSKSKSELLYDWRFTASPFWRQAPGDSRPENFPCRADDAYVTYLMLSRQPGHLTVVSFT
jgi:hypothetical protein